MTEWGIDNLKRIASWDLLTLTHYATLLFQLHAFKLLQLRLRHMFEGMSDFKFKFKTEYASYFYDSVYEVLMKHCEKHKDKFKEKYSEIKPIIDKNVDELQGQLFKMDISEKLSF